MQRERLVLGTLLALVLARGRPGAAAYQLLTATIRADDGSYASSFMALSGYHAFHLLLTLFIGIGVWNRARLGRYAGDHWQVRMVGLLVGVGHGVGDPHRRHVVADMTTDLRAARRG